MTKKKITIKDVARISEVSIATVSQILNGHEDKFSPKTVARVLEAKKKLHYEPDYFAQRMIVKKSKTIGVLVPDITNPFFGTLLRGIEKILYKENFMTILCNTDSDEKKEIDYLDELSRRGVDGFIIASSAISNEAINDILQKRNYPFIVLDQKKAEGFSDAVLTDDYAGGRLAAQHLQNLGHQKIAVIMPENVTENVHNRLMGFRSVVKNEGQVKLIFTEMSKQGGKRAVSDILKADVTALFAINDELAFGLYNGLTKAGKKIPADFSIVGYDDTEMCEYVTPQLTTIAQPILELGQTTAEMLLERIRHPEKEWEEKTLTVRLIKRFSTAHLK